MWGNDYFHKGWHIFTFYPQVKTYVSNNLPKKKIVKININTLYFCICQVFMALWICYSLCANCLTLNILSFFLCVSWICWPGQQENKAPASCLCVAGLISVALKDEALLAFSSPWGVSLSLSLALSLSVCPFHRHTKVSVCCVNADLHAFQSKFPIWW